MNVKLAIIVVKVYPDADIHWISVLWLHISNACYTVLNEPHSALT